MNILTYFKYYYNCTNTILHNLTIVLIKEYEYKAIITHISVHVILF